MSQEIKCNICGSYDYKVVYGPKLKYKKTKEKYLITDFRVGLSERIVKCKKCGLIYQNPRSEGYSLLRNYAEMIDEKYLEEEEGRRISASQILRELKKLGKSGRILDVGCATGFLLDEAKKDGWEVYGVELSNWAVEYAKSHLGIEIFQGNLKTANFPDKFFDAVVLKDTIEHLLDPKEILVEIRRILKNDGIICLNTPNIGSLVSKLLGAKWWGIKQEHIYYFTERTLVKILDIAGFKPIRCKSYPRTFTLKYWVERCSVYNNFICNVLSYFLKKNFLSKRLIRINFGDQIEIFAAKSRKLKFIEELEENNEPVKRTKHKVIAVLPAYNAGKTLRKTVEDIPKEHVDEIILVDDASSDSTVNIARNLGLKVFVHDKNKGYGANQKTCYTQALKAGADIVVMVHPDYQYDPKVIPQLIEPIQKGQADAVFGSRMMKGGALEGGMPHWKYNANILLTALENVIFGIYLTEYHSGFRAYSSKYLKSVNLMANSDGFVFDTEIIAQGVLKNMRIEEIPIRTRYFDEASTIRFWPCVEYGFRIMFTLLKYMLHKNGIRKFNIFC